MSRPLLICAFCVLSLFLHAQTPFVCDGRFYITLVRGATTALVEVAIEPNTEQVEFVTINNNLNTIVNGIGYRAQDNFIYGVHPGEFHLYRIDRFGSIETLTTLPLSRGFVYLGADITEDGRYLVLIGSTDVEGFPLDRELVMVDLEDPNYGLTFRTISGANVNVLDIAFDPTDQTLYGFDSGGNRLVTLTLDGVVSVDFAPSDALEIAGSMFFDIFGNLFAYASPDGQDQNTLYAVDKTDGTFRVLAMGANARATDACSCPHSVELQKTVHPRSTIACAPVTYTFAISNQSERSHEDIELEDFMPLGFTITQILRNPFGGSVDSGPGSNFLQITGMTIPPGIDSLVVEVMLDDLPAGVYKNQAHLTGLPVGLGDSRLSDDPRTLRKRDSTKLIIEALNFDTLEIETLLCTGETLLLDASTYGTAFLWDDLSIQPQLEVAGPGQYTVRASTLCDTVHVIYIVQESRIDINVGTAFYEIDIGDSIQLSTTVTPAGMPADIVWTDPLASSLSCLMCPDPLARPLENVTYSVVATNSDGCVDAQEVVVQVDRSNSIYVPNVFSPNGDGINDLFFIQGKGVDKIASLAIYERFGGQVFGFSNGMVNDQTIAWDGSYQGRIAQPAVFAWVAEIIYLDGTSEIISGDVTLLR